MPEKRRIIIGVDESGRGPLAGPVVAGAVFIDGFFDIREQLNYFKIPDCKKLSFKKREEVFSFIQSHPKIHWAVGRAGERIIDRINILEATKLAMQRAVANLEKKLPESADLLLIDGNFGLDLPYQQQSIIKGDENVFLITLASIIAKVKRDRLMLNYHKRYPQYGFDSHKGYGTKKHYQALGRGGPCSLHRRTFRLLQK